MRIGDRWMHLRICQHAAKHFHATDHPVVRSIEPGETWAWCYIDRVEYDLARVGKHARVV